MSKQYLGSYINFQRRAREAMEFYHEGLGGKFELYAMDASAFQQGVKPRPAKPGESIANGRLVSDFGVIVGSDGNPGYPPTVGDNVAIALVVADEDRLIKTFGRLAEGGTIMMPLTTYSWASGSAAWLADRFGITWSVSMEPA